MAGSNFRLPGFQAELTSPDLYVTSVLRNFSEASRALGVAVDTLVVRLAAPSNERDPDYQIETLDGEDAAAFSGETHDFLDEDITVLIEAGKLQDQQYTAEQVKDWLNLVNGEGTGGGSLDPILSTTWKEGDVSDPRD